MTENAQTITTPGAIVVGLDFSELGDAALRTALSMAGSHHNVHVVHVVPTGMMRTSGQIDRTSTAIEDTGRKLKEYVAEKFARNARTASGHIGVHVRVGDPVKEILQLAVDVDADLLVVGTHGRTGVQRMVMGSVAEHLVRNAHCAVLVVRHKDYAGLAHTAQVDPPCPDCVRTRRESNNAQWWCATHGRAQVRTHHYSPSDSVACEMFDSNVIPTGVKF